MIYAIHFVLAAATAHGLPELACRGDLPAWVVRDKHSVHLNDDLEPFKVDPRRDPVVYLGTKVEKAWAKIDLRDRLRVSTQAKNYQSFLTLKIKTDSTSYLTARAAGILARFGESLDCVVDDDIRAAGAL